jgi:hypothetical protein
MGPPTTVPLAALAARRSEKALRGTVALLALLSVAPLLAWVYGLGRFAVWFRFVALPALLVVALVAWRASRPGSRHPDVRTAMVAGTIGGLVGTIGYDVFRLPFLALGYRLLAPIDSYGVLLLDGHSSSALSGFAGWAYHFSNGICFGIAYAMVALGRNWRWGLLWAMVLETASVVTPFADTYAISGRWGIIAIAYGAHVPYGLALGWAGSRGDALYGQLEEMGRRTPTFAVAALVVGLAVWHQPWSSGGAGSASTSVVAGRFSPAWVRVPVGGCIDIADGAERQHRCFAEAGVHRLRLNDRPYSGGFVIVDPELGREDDE